jgi:hypothetical protein
LSSFGNGVIEPRFPITSWSDADLPNPLRFLRSSVFQRFWVLSFLISVISANQW